MADCSGTPTFLPLTLSGDANGDCVVTEAAIPIFELSGVDDLHTIAGVVVSAGNKIVLSGHHDDNMHVQYVSGTGGDDDPVTIQFSSCCGAAGGADVYALAFSGTDGNTSATSAADPEGLLYNTTYNSHLGIDTSEEGGRIIVRKDVFFRSPADIIHAQAHSALPVAFDFEGIPVSGIGTLTASGGVDSATFTNLTVTDMKVGGAIASHTVDSALVATASVKSPIVSGTVVEAVEGVSGAIVSGTELKGVTVTGIDHGGLGGLTDDDHTHYLTKAPGTSNRNLITMGVANRPPLEIRSHATASVNLTSWEDADTTVPAYIDSNFNFVTSGSMTASSVSATEGRFVTVTGIDHGGLGGLGDDDHTQYPLVAGTRAFTGPQAGVAFGATEGVSGATVSGTSVDGVTAFASEGLSSAIVSGTVVSAVTYAGPGILDENDMATDSDTKLATQQSIKAYVDGQTHAAALTQEQVEDFAGALVATGGTKTGITVTYQDGTGDMDFVVAAQDHGGLGGLTDDDHTQYSKADGTRAFTGAVAGVSGTADASLATNLMCLSRSFHHNAYRSGSFTDGQAIRVYINTTDNDANCIVPAGESLKILAAYGRCKNGADETGTTWTLQIRAWTNQAHSSFTDYSLASAESADANTYQNIHARGTLASPLATIVGDNHPVFQAVIKHDSDEGLSSANDKHVIDIYGVFV